MEPLTLPVIFEIVKILGVIGLVILLWWFDQRSTAKIIEDHRVEQGKLLETYRADMKATLDSYREDMQEAREMYKNNVKLVEGYASIAQDLHDIVVLNIQEISGMRKSIESNQYCPMARFKKKSIEVRDE